MPDRKPHDTIPNILQGTASPLSSTSALSTKARLRSTVVMPSHKGGIGKSTTVRATTELVRRHLDSPIPFRCVAADGDGDNGQTLSFLGQYDEAGELVEPQSEIDGVLFFDARSPRERDLLVNLADREEELVIIDLPGGSLSDLERINVNLSSRDLVDAHRAAGRRLVVMLSVTPLLASLSSVITAVDQFGPDADYVVVKNMAAGDEEDFVLWNDGIVDRFGRQIGGNARRRIEKIGGRVLHMPALTPGIYARVDALGLCFTDALTSRLLTTSQRLSCRRWLHDWAAQLDGIADLLALPDGYGWRV